MSRSHARRQIDFNKPLILLDNADEFFQQDNPEGNDPNATGTVSTEKKRPGTDNRADGQQVKKKENIAIPIVKKLDDPLNGLQYTDERLMKKRKVQSHYIRFSYCSFVPNPDVYEATDKDLEFLKELNEKISKNIKNSPIINMESFEKMIEAWEHATAKDDPIALSRAHTLAEPYHHPTVKDYVTEIYNYWIKQREKYKRPLLRRYLKVVNKDDTNPNAAFRTRENPKMKTRRAQKANDAEGLEKMKALKEDMDMAITLLANIRYREMVKLECCELSILKFEAQVREKTEGNVGPSLLQKYKETYENDKYLAIKNKMKEFNKKAQKIISDNALKEVEKPSTMIEPPRPSKTMPVKIPSSRQNTFLFQNSEELNFDVGAFIASVAEEAMKKDITPQNILMIASGEPGAEMEQEKVPNYGAPVARPTSFPQQFPPTETLRTERRPIQGPIKEQPQPVVQAQPEEKNIFKYRLRKRLDRFNRVVLERIFEEDENSYYAHHKDYYEKTSEQKEPILTNEVVDKIHNTNLHDLYVSRFSKYTEIYPFNDSDDDQDLSEFTKQIKKNLANNFRTFLRQKKQQMPGAPITNLVQ